MTLEASVQEQISESNQNKLSIRCRDCGSLILCAKTADFHEGTQSLPKVHQKKDANADELECDNFQHFWKVKGMFTFENIGFSNTVAGKKYLICAMCERGPIGYHEEDTQISYVALERVKHE